MNAGPVVRSSSEMEARIASQSRTVTGWLLDVYPNETNLTLWVIGEDGFRHRFFQDFGATVHATGPFPRLRELWKWLAAQPIPVRRERVERLDVFRGLASATHVADTADDGAKLPRLTSVLAATVLQPARLDELFRQMTDAFPDLAYYDADISVPLRYAAAFNVFPLARCRLEVSGEKATTITPLITPWELEPQMPRLRSLSLEPDRDPAHGEPQVIWVAHEQVRYALSLKHRRALLVTLAAELRRYDPDILLTSWGDTWLLPFLKQASQEAGLPLPLNRDETQPLVERKEHTYFSYGQIVYRGAQVLLRGRWHLDRHNAMLWSDYGMDGVLEMARVTRQPAQEAARLSPGTGISSMQFVTAMQKGILIPWHKHQAETPKSALELLQSDMGGMVYQPTVGLHRDVAEIDFVSMYPGIMVHFNISPEVPRAGADLEPAPGEPGIVPATLEPLLRKRLALKSALLTLGKYDCRRRLYQACASAEKWLLVTCFGYLGYKNARFGRIEAHEAVTAYGREALLRAKEAAEDLGHEILHMYVDGIWLHKEGCKTPGDFEAVLAAITERTGLPISLDGVYRWVVFLPSRVNEETPVPNRYFGVFQDGSIKARGIEARRRDTPPFIAEVQMGILEILARAPDADHLKDVLFQAEAFAWRQLKALREGRVPAEKLLAAQKLSRELGEYSTPSPAARAVRQMESAGKTVRPGQRVRFLFTLGKPGVRAWDLPAPPDPRCIDLKRYQVLFERAVQTVLGPIRECVRGGADKECLYLFLLPLSRTWGHVQARTDRARQK
ncbi:MAG: DNA polymerase domain-containing protein [Bacteroidota bacterium]